MPENFPVQVLRDGVMGGKDSSQVVKVVLAYRLNAEIIKNEYKHDGAPFLALKYWLSSGFIVAIVVKARAEKVIGQLSGLGDPVSSLDNFEVNPSVMCIRGDNIFSINSCGMSSRRIWTNSGQSMGMAR